MGDGISDNRACDHLTHDGACILCGYTRQTREQLAAERDALRARVAELEAWQRTVIEELASERKFWRERGRAEERADVVAFGRARAKRLLADGGAEEGEQGAEADAFTDCIKRGDHVRSGGE
jgi:hypothetical protein